MSEEHAPHEFELAFVVEIAPAVDSDVAAEHARLVFEMTTNFLNTHRLDVRDSNLVRVEVPQQGEGLMTSQPERVEAKGRPSPRWAFWERMTIPCFDGLIYLVRLRIIQTPYFAIYLHDIHEPDGDRDPHNHPWSFASLVLRGGYTEKVYGDPSGDPDQYIIKKHRRFSLHFMGRSSAHRIVNAAPGLKTLIFVGPRKAGWGFFTDGEYTPWQEYEHLNGTVEQRVAQGQTP